jgi:flagellar basal-body rod protein FlgF
VSTGIWMAASGASAQITALDATANNLANANTAGYKVDQTIFREHLIQAMYVGRAARDMRYNGVETVAPDMRSGPLQITNKPLDVAIENDDAFFAIQTPRGERYTRGGAFQIGQEGTLVTAQGYPVLDASGNPISVQPDAKVLAFGNDGTLTVDDSDVGQLKLVKFRDIKGLEKDGDTMFRVTPRSGRAEVAPASVIPGALEMPNVSIVKGMTDLVSATRAFEALEKAVEAFSSLEHRAATDIVGAR